MDYSSRDMIIKKCSRCSLSFYDKEEHAQKLCPKCVERKINVITEGNVYLIGTKNAYGDEFVKVGVTKGSVEKRIVTLQTGNHLSMDKSYYVTCEKPYYIEKRMHMLLGDERVFREWFDVSFEKAVEMLDNLVAISYFE